MITSPLLRTVNGAAKFLFSASAKVAGETQKNLVQRHTGKHFLSAVSILCCFALPWNPGDMKQFFGGPYSIFNFIML